MAKINRWIPFSVLPASWGLTGKALEVAKASYYFDGEELERVLLDVEYKDDPETYKRKSLFLDKKYNKLDDYSLEESLLKLDNKLTPEEKIKLDFKHKKISEYDLEKNLALLKPEGDEREIDLQIIDYKYNKITKKEFQKNCANIRKEPYCALVNDEPFNTADGLKENCMYFDFDWNDKWIEYLRLNGFDGRTDEEIMEKFLKASFVDYLSTLPPDVNDQLIPRLGRVLF